MTLRLHKVTQQIDRLRESAVQRAEKRRSSLPKVEAKFHLAAVSESLPEKVRLAADKHRWNGALPVAGEAMNYHKAPPPLPSGLTLVAVDGSQVYPDPHEVSLYYAINIGYFILRFDRQKSEANSDPTVVYEEDEVLPGGHLISRTEIDARRTVEEMATLERLAVSERAASGGPVLALADGTLTLWLDEKGMNPATRAALQKRYLASLERLASEKIPVAGYVARPSRFPVLSLADLALSSSIEEASERSRSGRSPFPGIDDRALFEVLLPAGHRSTVFEFTSDWGETALERGPDQKIHFFYLNVGRRFPVISRVEIPEWTAGNPGLVDLVHAAMIEQCSVTLEDPYPYSLIRADEEAFISGVDTGYLEDQISVALIRGGLRVNRSEKLSHKGRARKR